MSSDPYIPEFAPADYDPDYINRELLKLAEMITTLLNGEVKVHHTAPDHPFTGLLTFADGTDWDPGSGRGVYVYDEDDTSWHLIVAT